jgi:hypothetical protein
MRACVRICPNFAASGTGVIGMTKILDFGLAKAGGRTGAGGDDLLNLATCTSTRAAAPASASRPTLRAGSHPRSSFVTIGMPMAVMLDQITPADIDRVWANSRPISAPMSRVLHPFR